MQRTKIKTIVKNDEYELLFNLENRQPIVLERIFSERIRNCRSYAELKKACNINNETISEFNNTYRYLVQSGFFDVDENVNFQKRLFQWQDLSVDIVTSIDNLNCVEYEIENNEMLVNNLMIVVPDNYDIKDFYKTNKFSKNLHSFLSLSSVIIGVRKNNMLERLKWIKEYYNQFDEIVVILLEMVDFEIANEYMPNDINNKINYQIYIEDLIKYRNTFNYFVLKNYKIKFSSKVFCIFAEIEPSVKQYAPYVTTLLENNKYCLESLGQDEESVWDSVFPYTFNCKDNIYLLYSNKRISKVRTQKCENECSYSLFCPYVSNGLKCEFKIMLSKALGVDL